MTRLEVLKTYKIYIGGQFPRTESGHYYKLSNKKGKHLANICLSSRKDFKNAVTEARKAFNNWSNRTAYNRSQILYRIAEILESRKDLFIAEIVKLGSTAKQAEAQTALCIDRLVYYAGWCDKYTQIYSTVNPVASSHFNFSFPEPTGVVAIIAPEESSLLGLISIIAPVIAGGNTCIVLASESKPLSAVSFAEVLNSSDVPGGTINILTGKSSELSKYFASHMDVNAIIYARAHKEEIKAVQEAAVKNMKRVFIYDKINWNLENSQGPEFILNTLEIKTTWHPVESISVSGAGY